MISKRTNTFLSLVEGVISRTKSRP